MCNYFEIYALFGIVIWRRERVLRNNPRRKTLTGQKTMKITRHAHTEIHIRTDISNISRILKVSVSANSLYLYLYGYLVVTVCMCVCVCLHIMGRILFSFSFLSLVDNVVGAGCSFH